MDGLNELLTKLHRQLPPGVTFIGLLNVLIGRKILNSQGQVISSGLTWRTAAVWLKRVRWDRDAVRDLGLDPRNLAPRDRERFWYGAIAHAQVDSPVARRAGDQAAVALAQLGYRVDPTAGASPESAASGA